MLINYNATLLSCSYRSTGAACCYRYVMFFIFYFDGDGTIPADWVCNEPRLQRILFSLIRCLFFFVCSWKTMSEFYEAHFSAILSYHFFSFSFSLTRQQYAGGEDFFFLSASRLGTCRWRGLRSRQACFGFRNPPLRVKQMGAHLAQKVEAYIWYGPCFRCSIPKILFWQEFPLQEFKNVMSRLMKSQPSIILTRCSIYIYNGQVEIIRKQSTNTI